RLGLPVACPGPFLRQPAVLPGERVLAPDLGVPRRRARVAPRLHLHEDVVSVEERRLVMSEEVAKARLLLVGHERVVDDVREESVGALADGAGLTGVLRVLAPLRPGAGTRCGRDDRRDRGA